MDGKTPSEIVEYIKNLKGRRVVGEDGVVEIYVDKVPTKEEPPVDEELTQKLAPNLCALLGPQVAAKFIKSDEDLTNFAFMNPVDIQYIGTSTSDNYPFRVGYLKQTQLYQATPPGWRLIAARLLAYRSSAAAHADRFNSHPNGKRGRSIRRHFLRRIDKWNKKVAAQPAP